MWGFQKLLSTSTLCSEIWRKHHREHLRTCEIRAYWIWGHSGPKPIFHQLLDFPKCLFWVVGQNGVWVSRNEGHFRGSVWQSLKNLIIYPFPVNIHAGKCSQFPLGKARRKIILSIFCYVTGFFLKSICSPLCSRYSEPVNWFRFGNWLKNWS